MTFFLAVCVGMFGAFVVIDLADVKKKTSGFNWAFLIFNTGMFLFATHSLLERF